MANEVVFNHTAHKELWNWLAQNPHKCKQQWPGWRHNGGIYSYDTTEAGCFACQYVYEIVEYTCKRTCTQYCPLNGLNACDGDNSPYAWYFYFLRTGQCSRASFMAEYIANLNVKSGVEVI